MTLSLAGVLPVSAVNLGLVASLGGLNVEIAKLQVDIADLNAALVTQAQVVPPTAATFATAVASLNAANLGAMLGSFVTLSAGANADIAADLGVVTGQIQAVEAITGSLSAGLAVGGIAGYSYAGRASGFGSTLAGSTSAGFGRIDGDSQISGVILATESFASWGSLSSGVETGSSAVEVAPTGSERLDYLGTLSGAQWNTGTADLLARLELFLAELEGLKATLEAQLQITLGVNLPSVSDLLDVDIDIDAAFDAFSVSLNLNANISGIQARIDIILDLIAEISAQLSAGGLAVWHYSGRADQIGRELRDALAGGVPQGTGPNAVAYGLALGAESFGAFGSIFAVA